MVINILLFDVKVGGGLLSTIASDSSFITRTVVQLIFLLFIEKST